MRCTACNRPLKAEPLTVGRYPYGPVCFEKMFPPTKIMRIKHAQVTPDDKTIDLFAPCYFDQQGNIDRLDLGQKQE